MADIKLNSATSTNLSDSDWSDTSDTEVDMSAENQMVKCMFTDQTFQTAESYYHHLRENYGFDIWKVVHSELQIDFFGYVKLVNYLRSNYDGKKPPTSEELCGCKETWDVEKYLKPVVPDDPLLQFMIDIDEDEDFNHDTNDMNCNSNTKESCQMDDQSDVKFLKKEVARLTTKTTQLQSHLSETLSKMSEMKTFMKDCILTGDIYRPVSACRMKQAEEEEAYEDSGYFGSYSHHDIHAEMLQDKVRTEAYRSAIMQNLDVFKNKVVLDVGCGTGILSMFAAKAGAKHVYAVDMSDVAYHAMDIVRENNLSDKITVIKGFVEEVDLPSNQVDIIISEWMGYFLLYESMLDSVLYAAGKWLAPNGLILPDNCTIHLAAVHDKKLLNNQVYFWQDVYGFKMNCLKSKSLLEAAVELVDPLSVISDSVEVLNLCLYSTKAKDLNYTSDFVLKINKDDQVSGIVGYFDVNFKKGLTTPVTFSTAPWNKSTHWKQTLFFLKEPMDVKEGDLISGNINCHKHPKDPRSLEIELKIGDRVQTFTVS